MKNYGVLFILMISFATMSFAKNQVQYNPGNQQGNRTQPGQIRGANQHSDVLAVQYEEEGITAAEGKTVEVIVEIDVDQDEEK